MKTKNEIITYFNFDNMNILNENKYIIHLSKILKNFKFSNIDYKVIENFSKKKSNYSLSFIILKDIVKIYDKTSFIEWYNNNTMYIYRNYIHNLNNYDYNQHYNNDFIEIKDIYVNPFISYEINEWIHLNIKYKYICSNNIYNIKIFTKNKINSKIINNIHNVIIFFNLVTNKKKFIHLTIYLTPFKKELKEKLNSNAVNTGSTNYSKITIWREEELIKVLIHELIHYNNIDMNDDKYISNKIKKIVNVDINSSIKINEAYTELFAIFLHSVFFTLKIKKKFDLITLKKILLIETCWSIYQTAKILNHFKCFAKFNDILDKNINCKLIQTTSVFSYFIVKTTLLFDINNFFSLLMDMKQQSFEFIDSIENYNKFYNFIIKCFKNKKLNNLIDSLLIIKDLQYLKTMKMGYFT